MILKPEDLRRVRPIAENLNDPNRLITYMHEAETLRLIDAIGAKLYYWLDCSDFSGPGPFEYDGVTITKAQYEALMCGGYYGSDECCNGNGHSVGLITAIAYIAYSRFIVNNPINATAFGVRYKDGEFSSRVEDMVLIRNSNDAKRIGEAYLEQVIEHCKALGLLCCGKQYKDKSIRMIRVGRHKL